MAVVTVEYHQARTHPLILAGLLGGWMVASLLGGFILGRLV